jgi:hypothetical protein
MYLSEKELKPLNKSELLKLAKYYAVEKAYKMLKSELLEAIRSKISISVPVEEVQKSVRVRRIEESQI